MSAIQELPEKDKDEILPVFSLKGWVGSIKLENTFKRIDKAINGRLWVADIDQNFIDGAKDEEGKYPRDVFYEIEDLLKSNDGYKNWCDLVSSIDNAIPVLQLKDSAQFKTQLNRLSALGRGVVLRFGFDDITSRRFVEFLQAVEEEQINDIFIVFDFGQITTQLVTQESINNIVGILNYVNELITLPLISISGSSFPSSFSPFENGENPIVERLLFNRIKLEANDHRLIYSDRGSARVEKSGGGGGVPTPRIDYPLFNDWRFVRKEFEGAGDPTKEEKSILYTLAAKQVIASNYWDEKLDLWGSQLIELTAKGDSYGINNPQKCTAARINIHLYLQLHYDLQGQDDLYDTDEDWED